MLELEVEPGQGKSSVLELALGSGIGLGLKTWFGRLLGPRPFFDDNTKGRAVTRETGCCDR